MQIDFKGADIFHLDDEDWVIENFQKTLEVCAPELRYEGFTSAESFWKRLEEGPLPRVILLDLYLFPENEADQEHSGLLAIARLREKFSGPLFIFSAFAHPLKTSMELGASDFISKAQPWPKVIERIQKSLENSFKTIALSQGAGQSLEEALGRAAKIINSPIRSIFLTGESGSGKEVFAQNFRALLPKNQAFLGINCGALTPDLAEADLFGSERGSYTGSFRDRPGFIEEAEGGWLFLDEIAALPMRAQTALLRVLETGEYLRVGSTKVRKANIKVLSATHENMAELIAKKLFREDLWHRLSSFELNLAPWRKREPSEKALILGSLLEKISKEVIYTLSAEARDFLLEEKFKSGNIRELYHTLLSMSVASPEIVIDGKRLLTPAHIPSRLFMKDAEKPVAGKHSKTDVFKRSLLTYLQSRGEAISFRRAARDLGCSREKLEHHLLALLQKKEISKDLLKGILPSFFPTEKRNTYESLSKEASL